MNQLPSVMSPQHSFWMVPQAEIERSSFDRSHGLKTTFDAGYLIPVFWEHVVYPGDTMNLNMSFVCRLTTPFKPVMDNMYLESFFFFVPMRLLWIDWEKFCGSQDNPGDSTSFSIPQVASPTTPGIPSKHLFDYFGLPVGLAASFNFNNLLGRAYNKIWNKWFRDQNMQNSVTEDTGDGPDTFANYNLLRRGKRFDYFTSCLTAPQKAPAVTLPLTGSATVKTNATDLVTGSGLNPMRLHTVDNTAFPGADALYGTRNRSGNFAEMGTSTTGGTDTATTSLLPSNLYADLSTVISAITINALRLSVQTQKLYERDARAGTRYTEIVRGHFGVVSPDARLQRPEYLGGGSSPLNITPVAQTTAQSSPTLKDGQGNLAGFGHAVGSGHGFTKSFTEHGVLIGLVSVRADLTYQQGLDREFSYRTRFDMYWPALAHIGEQSVLNQEIFAATPGAGNDILVFGYQERYAECRYKPSKITGLFRSNVSTGFTPIDYWHLSQNFSALPTLNTTFIQDTPPIDRVAQVTSAGGAPHFFFDGWFDYKCARPMPVYSVPGLMDRF